MTELTRGAIVGFGCSVPAKVLTNADFEKYLDTSNEWIVQRTGIRERRVVGEGESTVTLALAASRQALDDAGLGADELDMIICATVTPDMPFPGTSCLLQQALGITDVPSFDLSAACSGFVYGLAMANGLMATGPYRNILVVGVDVLTRMTDYDDRGSCILFGDAAGAVVLQRTGEPEKGLMYFRLGADGSGWDFIHIPAGGSRMPATPHTVEDRQHYIKMRGRDVYKFAVQKMAFLIKDAMEACSLSADEVDLVVPHQVNRRIIESAAQKAGFPMEKVYVNIDRFGNTSAASIPLALAEAREAGEVKPGSTIVMVAFGAGLTWASGVIKL